MEWIYKGLVLLVIGCPCALVISTPVTIISSLACAAREGIVIKGGKYLEEGRLLKNVALDKTGTITTGRPVCTDVIPVSPKLSEAAALERASAFRSFLTIRFPPLSRMPRGKLSRSAARQKT